MIITHLLNSHELKILQRRALQILEIQAENDLKKMKLYIIQYIGFDRNKSPC